ncbi:hypothetical protein BDQ17DRAFT_1499905 [Cyathus striatus]|nr:hypothetical protein BDQ17DRAFT_1499905 [Cyathus striatus]
MVSTSPPTDLWLERSRLAGMILTAFAYGIFFILSIQSSLSIVRGMRARGTNGKLQPGFGYILLAYVGVTFALGTIGMGANSKYTEDIWINFRADGRTPEDLIINEFDFWYNRLAVDTQYVLVWILDTLLFYRCIVIWNFQLWVSILMGSIFLSIVGLSTSIMVLAGKSAVFSGLKLQIGFLAMSCSYNFLFTFLVSLQLLMARRRMKNVLGGKHLIPYTSITATLVESTSLYLIFELIYLFAFAFHSNVQNLLLLQNALVQAISQLLIIIRVAQGREYNHTSVTVVTTQGGGRSAPIAFRHTDHGDESGGATESVYEVADTPKCEEKEIVIQEV